MLHYAAPPAATFTLETREAIAERLTNEANLALKSGARVGQPTPHLYDADHAVIAAVAKELAKLHRAVAGIKAAAAGDE